jgi:hypothetical protein|tara:strand:- start:1191 stop:1616 length:426 start_codon:yes stop_codon:yes gene_type:complete
MEETISSSNSPNIDSRISTNLGDLKQLFEKEQETYLSNEEILRNVKEMLMYKKHNEVKKKKIANYNEYYKFFVSKFMRLHMNLPTIFNKVLEDDNFELHRLNEMLSMRKNVDDKKITNFDASVKISQKYTDEFVKKPLHIE